MLIDEDFLRDNCIDRYEFKEKFISRKNDVYLVEALDKNGYIKKYIYKLFHDEITAAKEASMLQGLYGKGLAVPYVYYSRNQCNVLQFVQGDCLLDRVNYLETCRKQSSLPILSSDTKKLIFQFCSWLKAFYKATKDIYGKSIILNDINFRNFIYNDSFFGLDFEDCKEGIMEEDAGKICAYALTYLPAFSQWKYSFVKEFLNQISVELLLDRDQVKQKMFKELASIKHRRNLELPSDMIDTLSFL